MRITEVDSKVLGEISLGDYTKKAKFKQASAQMSKAFGHDRSPERMAQLDREIANRGKGLERAKVRSDKIHANAEAKRKAEHEAAIRAKYADVDIDAEIAKLQPALKSAYHDYQYGARNTWHQGKEEYDRLSARIRELEHAKDLLGESATAGATMAANIGTVDAPQLSPGKARGKKSYTGSPTTGSGTKAPPQPVVKQPKKSDGTAVNALDMKGANLFGGGTVKRS
mgnify:CR=1 FL=1